MKRLIAILLLICTFLPACASTAGSKITTTEPKEPLDKIATWATHSYDKGRVDLDVPKNHKSDFEIWLAKNETEGFQIGVYSETDVKKLKFNIVSGNTTDISVSVYNVVGILKKGRKHYTDPCLPYFENRTFNLVGDESTYVLIEFKTTAETPAGKYEYSFNITDKDGNVLAENNATVNVWDFAMPEKLTFESQIWGSLNLTYYEALLDHNLSAGELPYDILDDRANEYMSNPKVTSFQVPVCEGNDEKLLQYYEKLKTNEEWLKKAVFYPLDEPTSITMLNELKEKCERLKRLCPEIRITSAYYTNIQYNNELDQIDFMDQYIDLHCPKLANWDYERIYSPEQMQRYDSFADRMKALQKKGETVWTYVCNYPIAPYLNVKVDDDGIVSRVLFWQMYQREIQGFLYWGCTAWWRLPDDNPWKSVDTFGNGIYGDGILFYPGEKKGFPGPVAAIRLKYIRDGIDDIELFYLAEDLLGRDWVLERVNKASKNLTDVSVSDDKFAALRTEIGNAVEAALKNK